MDRGYCHNRFDKFIAGKKPNSKIKISDDVAAKANTTRRLCNCPGSEPGKVKIDVNEHVPGCRYLSGYLSAKRSTRYATKTLVIPDKIVDGCSLRVVLGEEYI